MSSDSFTANLFTDDTEESVLVEFDIEEGQKEIRNPTDNAQPGIPPSIELTAVRLSGNDVLSNLSIPQYEDIVSQAWKYLEERKEDSYEASTEALNKRYPHRHW